ncbi:MAG: ferritin-like domain-containing protein [Armatimonadetes bacterium]|nr:ferritin-like domain-containing protein [Armatimonadota bacterium]
MHQESIALLNAAAADELTAVHQYMYFHFHCNDQGYDLLAGLFRRTAIEEMLHIERLAERILFLKGDVKLVPSAEVQAVTDVRQMLQISRDMEENSAVAYGKWANECGGRGDSASKQLFESLVLDEERHYGSFDTELGNLERFGDKYLALQSMERSRAVAAAAAAAPL